MFHFLFLFMFSLRNIALLKTITNLYKMDAMMLMTACTGAHFLLSSTRRNSNSIDKEAVNGLEIASVSDLTVLRKEYSESTLSDEDIRNDPMDLFSVWLNEACHAKVIEPNAMCLSTCLVSANNIHTIIITHCNNFYCKD